MKPIRVLIVDDSATIRQLIKASLVLDPRLMVVGEAKDPYDAREKIKALRPDILTLDVEMPKMSGLEFLEKLMRLRPMPVVMISAETHSGSIAALNALSLGAVECIGKPDAAQLPHGLTNLPDLLCAAAAAQLRVPRAEQFSVPPGDFSWNGRYVFIGASTGGVDALETILSSYPENCPPTLITQHMPESFLASFAARLASRIAPSLNLAQDGLPLKQGQVYLAPGGSHHLTVTDGVMPSCKLQPAEKYDGHIPSVDSMFKSAIPLATKSVAVLLTGMGRDGAAEMGRLRDAGARCFAQDAASCVVYGMPRAAIETGAAEAGLPLGRIAEKILDLTSRGCRTAPVSRKLPEKAG